LVIDCDRRIAPHLDVSDANLARDPAVDGAPGAEMGVVLSGHDAAKIGGFEPKPKAGG
jgi:hypothetical protein